MEFLETTICLILARTTLWLEEQGHTDIYDRFPSVGRMIQTVTETDIKAWSHAEGIGRERYDRLLRLAGDTDQEDHVIESAIDLCLAVLHIPEFAALLQYYTGSGVTLNLAYRLEGISFPSWEDVRRKLNGLSRICYIDQRKSPVRYVELMLDDRVFAYLQGDDLPGEPLRSLCSILSYKEELHPLYAYEELARRAAAHLKIPEAASPPASADYEDPTGQTAVWPQSTICDRPAQGSSSCPGTAGHVVQLAGIGGRRFLTRHIGKLLKKDIILADLTNWAGMNDKDFPVYSMQLIREALFDDAGICLYGLTEESLRSIGVSVTALTEYLLLPVSRLGIPLILCTDMDSLVFSTLEIGSGSLQGTITDKDSIQSPQHASEYGQTILRLTLTPLDYQMRKNIWQGFISRYSLDLDAASCAQHYRLLPDEISRVLEAWQAQGGLKGSKDANFHFSRLCYQVVSQNIKDTPGSSLGCVIYPQICLDDLKIAASIREDLDHVIASVNGSGKIFEEWDLKSKYAYGRAVTVLLCGPPGTGKTMSAHAVANALGIPLYQVNLSNIVDKYIGETEKHLEQAFLYAEKTNMVLFFDEADSLFGRRSEVSDAKDKYANTEVSYLLQRIEQYEGVVLMATNLMNNIDPAFLRRMKYVVRFQPPDESLRLAIWKSCLAPKLPTDHLDLPYLARQFDFCGGTIKNILLNACAISVCENEVLNMRHILKAVRDEYLKMDRIIDADMWGEYAYLISL